MTQKNIYVTNGVFLFAVLFIFSGVITHSLPMMNSDVLIFAGYAIVLVVALLVFRWQKVPVHYILPYEAHINPRNVLITIGLCITTYPFASTIYYITNQFFSDTLSEMMSSVDYSGYHLIYLLFVLAITPAFGEELLARGLVFGSVRQSGNAKLAILISALFFGLIHVNLTQFFYAFAIGIVLGIEREKTGCLWISMMHHFFNNGLSALKLYFFDRNPAIANAISLMDLDYMNHPVISAIAAVICFILMCLLLKVLGPTEKAAREKAEMDEFIAEDRAAMTGKKPTGITILLVIVLIYFAYFAFAITFRT